MFIALLKLQILFLKENLLFSFPWQRTKFLEDFFFILTFLESQCTKLLRKTKHDRTVIFQSNTLKERMERSTLGARPVSQEIMNF